MTFRYSPFLARFCAAICLLESTVLFAAPARDPGAAFKGSVLPILKEHCYDCHADGVSKGSVAFDELKPEQVAAAPELWAKVLKNVRAGIMPPEKKPRLLAGEIETLERWIKYQAFGLDPGNPDPGRVTLRRLNRVEYRNTIRDMMGFDFKADEEFPPDDTGYGFDNIGDVLSISPMLLEKYMRAAETIVASAVPLVGKVMPEKSYSGTEFRRTNGVNPDRLSFYEPAELSKSIKVPQDGEYKLALEFDVFGQFDFDPGRCAVALEVDGRRVWTNEFGWNAGKRLRFEAGQKLTAGEHSVKLTVRPLVPAEKKANSLDLRFEGLVVHGPLDPKQWTRTKNYERYFSKEAPPSTAAERQAYAREILSAFASKAFRRPVDDATVTRLAKVAENTYSLPGKTFEEGVSRAMVAVLSSPRFLFRVEESAGSPAKTFADVDEYALASRLSYFLWSTMPDEQLTVLARAGRLRASLAGQVKRLLADRRSEALVENFTGQWLQARDVDGIDINGREVIARDRGEEKEIKFSRKRFQELQAKPELTPEEQAERERLIEQRKKRFANRSVPELDGGLRRAMREETEMCFAHVVRENRSVLELIDADYTFLNERLARHYGLTNLNVFGQHMRKVSLPAGSPRGGVLTEGTVLVVTSNPTRTSPVKRGLFVLDNILGTPPPPPPPDIPQLEESEKDFKDHEPTLREVLAVHRAKPLCSSCHNRMDPLGLALEQFNALGMWREKERGQAIEASGRLITGEQFSDIRELKQVIVKDRRIDYYRCLTEKLLTYALGRGLEHYDVETVDQIVTGLEKEQGRFSALLMGIVESAPFQKRRNNSSSNPAAQTSNAAGQQPRS